MTTSAERDALVLQYSEYARALVLELSTTLPRFLSRDDMLSAGLAGLVEAATRFDSKRGAHFKTFAYYRVRGAVMDHARKSASMDPYHRARLSGLAAADDMVQAQLEARPRNVTDGPAEAATALASVLDAAAAVFTVSECAAALHSEGSSFEDPAAATERNQQAAVLRAALKKLPEKEQFMLRSVYFENLTIEEAGKSLGLSKSWASRLHARALQLAREAFPENV